MKKNRLANDGPDRQMNLKIGRLPRVGQVRQVRPVRQSSRKAKFFCLQKSGFQLYYFSKKG